MNAIFFHFNAAAVSDEDADAARGENRQSSHGKSMWLERKGVSIYFIEIQDLVSSFTRPHQMLQYNSEACEAMRKIILDSKAHGEALSREFDGDKSKEQIGSRRIISSIALLLSKLQRAGSDHGRFIRHFVQSIFCTLFQILCIFTNKRLFKCILFTHIFFLLQLYLLLCLLLVAAAAIL